MRLLPRPASARARPSIRSTSRCSCDGEEDPAFAALLARLGKHSRGDGGCLYVNKLADIDLAVLEEMIALGWKNSFERYPDCTALR